MTSQSTRWDWSARLTATAATHLTADSIAAASSAMCTAAAQACRHRARWRSSMNSARPSPGAICALVIWSCSDAARPHMQASMWEKGASCTHHPQAERCGSIRWAQSIGPGSPRLIGEVRIRQHRRSGADLALLHRLIGAGVVGRDGAGVDGRRFDGQRGRCAGDSQQQRRSDGG